MEIFNRYANTWNIVTISRVKGILSEEIVRQALLCVQQHHPYLNARIIGSLENLQFEFTKSQIPLRIINTNTEDWQNIVDEELNEKINSNISLIRTVLINCSSNSQINYLITTTHHAISDALSCIQLHSELLTCCQHIVSGEPISSIPIVALPPIEKLLPKWTYGVRGNLTKNLYFIKLLLQEFWYQPQILKIEANAVLEKRCSRMLHHQLPPKTTQRFINSCKQNKVTVHGALCAGLLLAVVREIAPNQTSKINVSCESAVDLRRRLQPEITNEHLGIMACILKTWHKIAINSSFWDLARDVKQQLEIGIRHQNPFKVVLNAKLISKYLLKHAQNVASTVNITNIGKVNIPKIYGCFELEEISFVSSYALFTGTFAVCTSSFQDKLLFNFMFSEPSLSKETIERLANSVISIINQVSIEAGD